MTPFNSLIWHFRETIRALSRFRHHFRGFLSQNAIFNGDAELHKMTDLAKKIEFCIFWISFAFLRVRELLEGAFDCEPTPTKYGLTDLIAL